jgi:carbon storage regulator
MLVLSRKLNETIVIDGNIRITVVGLRGSHVRIGIEAPDRVHILREELYDADRANGVEPVGRPAAVEWSGLAGKVARRAAASSARSATDG